MRVFQPIERVLAEERRAKEAIARCEQEAQALVAQARERARRILERADARISALHATCSLTTAQRLAAFATAIEELKGEPVIEAIHRDRLQAALDALLKELFP